VQEPGHVAKTRLWHIANTTQGCGKTCQAQKVAPLTAFVQFTTLGLLGQESSQRRNMGVVDTGRRRRDNNLGHDNSGSAIRLPRAIRDAFNRWTPVKPKDTLSSPYTSERRCGSGNGLSLCCKKASVHESIRSEVTRWVGRTIRAASRSLFVHLRFTNGANGVVLMFL
jgi:hypothetical protein